MKKMLLVLFSTALLFGCSSSSDDTNSSNSNRLNPPSWIQGTWVFDYPNNTDPSDGIAFCKLTSNDYCVLTSNMQICLVSGDPVGAYQYEETITNNEYKFVMSSKFGGISTNYHFIKVSSTKIQYINPTKGLPNLSLRKQ